MKKPPIDQVLHACFSAILSDGKAFIKTINMLEPEYFQPPLCNVVSYMKDEYIKNNKPVPLQMVNAKFGLGFEVIAPHQSEALSEIAIKQLENYCKYAAMMLAITEGADLISNGLEEQNIEEKNGILKTLVENALKVGIEPDLGISLFDVSVEERHKMLSESIDVVTTGFSEFDRYIGGWTRGELIIFLGPSAGGKSITLTNIARQMATQRNTLYITFELDEQRVASRFDAIFGGIPSKEIEKHSQKLQQIYSSMNTNLQIKRMPQGTNCIQIRAYLAEYYGRFGHYPEVLILDHMDLMYPNDKRLIQHGAFERDKAIAEEMREIFAEFNMYGFTASQLNRDAVGANKYGHHHVGGGLSKIQTADLAIGIHRDEQHKKEQIIEYEFMKVRNDEDPCVPIFLRFDPLSLRIEDLPANELASVKARFGNEDSQPKKEQKKLVDKNKSVKELMKGYMDKY